MVVLSQASEPHSGAPRLIKEEKVEQQKHSGLGIASFITAIVSGVFMFLLIMVAGVIEVSTPGGMDDESAGAVIIGLLLFVLVGALLVAIGLGVGGLVQGGRKKVFAVLGTVFSTAILLGTVFLLIIGLAME